MLPPRLVEEGLHAIRVCASAPQPRRDRLTLAHVAPAVPFSSWPKPATFQAQLPPPSTKLSPTPLQPTHTFQLLLSSPQTQALPTLRAKLFRLTLQPQLHRGMLGLGSVSDFIYAPGVREDSERQR